MTKQKEKKKASIVKKMMIAVVAGFVVGFICLLIKSAVMGTDGEGAWKVVEAILFQDITATKDIEGLGLFYAAAISLCLYEYVFPFMLSCDNTL